MGDGPDRYWLRLRRHSDNRCHLHTYEREERVYIRLYEDTDDIAYAANAGDIV